MTLPASQSQTCSASTTASNSHLADFASDSSHFSAQKLSTFKGEVICDWLSFRHEFAIEKPTNAIESGHTLKIDQEGQIEWEKTDFSNIKCVSSDTNVRIKCDGNRLHFSGNIGRFGQTDNRQGLTVIQCIEKALELINRMFPQVDTRLMGSIQRLGTISEYGTYITRLDLASNFETDNYAALAQLFSQRKILTKLPIVGKYGPTWGYDAKRGQYWKAKLYDKQAELDGKRIPYSAQTTARFEIQLGSEYLRQNKLHHVANWTEKMKTENIIYGRFINPLLQEQLTGNELVDLPSKLRQHAVLWRDGTDPKSYLKKSQYFRIKRELLDLGLDISRPCNILHLSRPVKLIQFVNVSTLRKAA